MRSFEDACWMVYRHEGQKWRTCIT
uniref:Uncharacterized protein n=1 Tax=Arundo donax TaxID=35708 RepID=A0A0A9FEE9_ARUDO